MQLDNLIVGSPEDASEQLANYRAVDVDEIVVRCLSVPQELALETIELVGPLDL
jgi:alkanesulfonate monooxygenase SsuD/methylene tetrahydromethanopterin reductase-like flavin-dependent oxidoreductase (luciferase family)